MTTTMHKEIWEQPSVAAKTLEGLGDLKAAIAKLSVKPKRVLFFARGTSDNAANYGLYAFPVIAGLDASSGSPSLATNYEVNVDLQDTLVVCISQSGSTQEICDSAEWAKSHGATTVAITNGEGSRLSRVCDITIYLKAGPELAVPATKTYTTSLVAIAMLAGVLANDEAFLGELRNVPSAIEQTLNGADVKQLAQALAAHDEVVLTGRGFSLSAASEIALKLKETCYILAMGGSTADLQHGPLAVLDETTPLVVFDPHPNSPVQSGLDAVAERGVAVGAPVFRIGIKGSPGLSTAELPEPLMPMLLPLPGQLAVESAAQLRGLNPDNPRGLTKVTQTS